MSDNNMCEWESKFWDLYKELDDMKSERNKMFNTMEYIYSNNDITLTALARNKDYIVKDRLEVMSDDIHKVIKHLL